MANQTNQSPSVPSQIVGKVNFPQFFQTIGTIPSSYKECLTYEAQINWLVNFLQNTLIPTVNENGQAVEELQGLYEDLRIYVDSYFTNLDVQEEINKKLDNMAQDGSLTALIKGYVDPFIEEQNEDIQDFEDSVRAEINSFDARLTAVASGSPKGVYSRIEDLRNANPETGVYIVSTNGHIYAWTKNQSEDPTDLGVYQSTGIGDGEVVLNNLDNNLQNKLEIKRLNPNFTSGKSYDRNGNLNQGSGFNNYHISDIIELRKGETIHFEGTGYSDQTGIFCTCDEDGENIKVVKTSTSGVNVYEFTAYEDTYIITSSYVKSDHNIYTYIKQNTVELLSNKEMINERNNLITENENFSNSRISITKNNLQDKLFDKELHCVVNTDGTQQSNWNYYLFKDFTIGNNRQKNAKTQKIKI